MWGCILTDHVSQASFSVGYTAMKSDAVVHLAQWQYWWWFWFSFLWGFYYLTAAKVVRGHMLKFRPRIYTSYRSHGKWGDFLACIVPAIWCLNILTSSSFIMRLLEWQYELSLFNVRIRGRQWYWVYKFELRHIIDIASVPKNIGHNKWLVSLGNLFEVTDDYLHALSIRSTNPAFKNYWQNSLTVLVKMLGDSTYFLMPSKSKIDKKILNSIQILNTPHARDDFPIFINTNLTPSFLFDEYENNKNIISSHYKLYADSWAIQRAIQPTGRRRSLVEKITFFKLSVGYKLSALCGEYRIWNAFFKSKVEYVDNNGNIIQLFDGNRTARRTESKTTPIFITKNNQKLTGISSLNEDSWTPFKISYNRTHQILSRSPDNQNALVIKQKRIKENTPVPIKVLSEELDPLVAVKLRLVPTQPTLQASGFLRSLEIHTSSLYKLMFQSRKRDELMSVQLSRRLLRTQRTLILPSQANLTLITNSYDVVHSWFLPSLGLKMDCVPGRSTHHTFYIDSLGFFYGQCAEICGRYHHHMPIRLCMLPFEHFFVWWQHFGLPKVLNLSPQTQEDLLMEVSRFSW